MQTRWLNRRNEETGENEVFYPITHANAIVGFEDYNPGYKVVMYPLSVTATEEGQTVFNIDLDIFDANTDMVMVQSGRTMLFPEEDYTVVGKTIVLVEGVEIDRVIGIYVFKNVEIPDEEVAFSGALLEEASVPLSKLSEMPSAENVGAAKHEELTQLTLSFAHFTTEEEIDNFYDSYSNSFPEGTWYRATLQHGTVHSILGGGRFYFEGYKTTDGYEFQRTTSYSESAIKQYVRSCYNGTWSEWTTGFLPLTGGWLSGDLIIKKDYGGFRIHNTAEDTGSSIGSFINRTRITAENVNGDQKNMRVLDLSNSVRFPNITQAVQFMDVVDNIAKSYNIYGEHNKPSGSYTGNGDATPRTINTGGIGRHFVIHCQTTDSFAIVGTRGGTGKVGTTPKTFNGDMAYSNAEGSFVIQTTDSLFNQNGAIYYYYVL